MVYYICDGLEFEKIIVKGNKKMIAILTKQNKQIKRKLMTQKEIISYSSLIEDSIKEVKLHYFARWKQASNYVEEGNYLSMLDHYLAIDNILEINEEVWVGIDWTLNNNRFDLLKKLEVHKKLRPAYKKLGLNKSIVVLINNSILINEDNAPKLLFKILKLIEQKISSVDFKGGISVDIKKLLL